MGTSMSAKTKLIVAQAAAEKAGKGWETFFEAQRQLSVQNQQAAKLQQDAAHAAFELGVEIGLFPPQHKTLIPGEVRFALVDMLLTGRLTFNSDIPITPPTKHNV